MSRSLQVLILAGVLMGVFGIALTQPMPAPSIPLFSSIGAQDARSIVVPPEQVGTRRSRLARLDPAALGQLRDGALALNLFNDASFVAVGEIRTDRSGPALSNTLWTGMAAGVPNSNVILVSDSAGNVDLRVLTLGRNYYVQSLGDGYVRISEIDPSAGRYDRYGQPINDAVVGAPTEDDQRFVAANRASPRADDGSVIDLMVVYTPAAVALLGSDAAAKLAIEGAVALTNVTYENSSVDFRVRLVHVALVDYVENGNELGRLSGTSDGYMDEVHQWRNAYAADLVALMPGTSVEDRQYCGNAHLPTFIPAPSFGFSVTEALCISDITLAHELGHNMGKAHDHANAFGAVHPYAYGYQDNSTGIGDYGDWVTVMAYSNGGECPGSYIPGVCPAIAWWSDKDATYDGKPLGNPGVNGEDNARSLNETALDVANYRISPDGGATTPTPFPTLTPIPTPGGSDIEPVLNGSFEIDNDANGLPDGWAWSSSAGTRNCAGNAADGTCLVALKSGAKIRQTVPLELGSLGGGDSFDLSLWAKAKASGSCGWAKLKVSYVDNTAGANANGKDVLKLTPSGPPKQWNLLFGTLVLDDTPKSVKLILAAGTACPKPLRFDDVSIAVLD